MLGINNSNMNRDAVLGSKILAKAAIKQQNGKIIILVAYQESTRHEFYWAFQARSARSARKSWKYAGHFGRDFNTAFKPYKDFESFVDHYARIRQGEVLSLRLLKRRGLAALYTKTAHESIHAEWAPRINSTDPRDYRWQQRRLAGKIKGRVIDPSWGK